MREREREREGDGERERRWDRGIQREIYNYVERERG